MTCSTTSITKWQRKMCVSYPHLLKTTCRLIGTSKSISSSSSLSLREANIENIQKNPSWSTRGSRTPTHLAPLLILLFALALANALPGSSIRVASIDSQPQASLPQAISPESPPAAAAASAALSRDRYQQSQWQESPPRRRSEVKKWLTSKRAESDERTRDLSRDRRKSEQRQLEGAFVRQLSDLIMNNEPATIRQKLTSEQIDGQLEAETNRLLLRTTLSAAASAMPSKLTTATTATSGSAESLLDTGALLAGPTSSEIESDDEDENEIEDDDDSDPGAGEFEAVESTTTTTRSTSQVASAKKRRHMSAAEANFDPEQPEISSSSSSGGSNGEQVDDPAGTTSSSEFLQDQENQQLSSEESQQQQQTVTCSPDYEDQSIVVDHDLSNPLGEQYAEANNLTQEQRQQIMNGADIAGLLQMPAGGHHNNNNNSGSSSQLFSQQHQQCVPAGSRMIEVITKVITPILFSIIIIVGLLGNIIVMLVILEDRKLERELTPTNLLILDLSLADLSFIIFCIPFTGWDYAVGHWVFGSLWCKFNQYLIVVCALSSIYTLVLMSCDRFMAIVYPIECISYRTSKNMLHAIIIKWIVILLIASPTILMHGLVDSPLGPEQFNCRFLSDQFNPLHFQFIFFITSYFLPLVLIFFLYLSLLRRLWCGQKPHGHKESTKMLESKKKVTWLVASIVLVFAACWFPIQIMLILMRLKTHKITATYVAIQVFAHTLGYMNSCVNPIVYAFASDTFNQSFKKSRLGRLCLTYLCCQPATAGHHISNNFNNNGHNNNNTTHIHHFGASSATNGGSGRNFDAASTNQHHGNYLTAGESPGRLGTRNSLQVTSAAGEFTLPVVTGRGNKSLSNIFHNQQLSMTTNGGHNGGSGRDMEEARSRLGASSPQPLALEPRDRPSAPSPAMQQSRISISSSANQLLERKEPQQPQQVVAKQQLVARMVQSSSARSYVAGNQQQQVSHDCQPSEQAALNCDVDGGGGGGCDSSHARRE